VLSEIVAVGSVLLALAAFLRAASVHRKLTTMSQSYWELRYEFARLRARVAKLDGGGQATAEAEESAHK